MSDAPDWQETAVGPGGTPIGGGGQDPMDWPPDQGFLGWSLPLWAPTASGTYVRGGTIAFFLVKAASSGTVGHIVAYHTNGATGVSSNENYFGLYSISPSGGPLSSITLLGSSAVGVADSLVSGSGFINVPLSSGVAVTAGTAYYVALLVNASGMPSWPQMGSGTPLVVVPDLPLDLLSDTAYTVLPPSIGVSAMRSIAETAWAAFSA